MGPGEWRRGEGRRSGEEAVHAGRRLEVPDLFGQQVAGARGARDRGELVAAGLDLSGGDLVFAALAVEQRPRPAAGDQRVVRKPEVPWVAVELLAVPVEGRAVPEEPVRRRDAELGVDDGERVDHGRVVGRKDAEPHEV